MVLCIRNDTGKYPGEESLPRSELNGFAERPATD
jgi:hypothetical protein